jgi:hypothetical protein
MRCLDLVAIWLPLVQHDAWAFIGVNSLSPAQKIRRCACSRQEQPTAWELAQFPSAAAHNDSLFPQALQGQFDGDLLIAIHTRSTMSRSRNSRP